MELATSTAHDKVGLGCRLPEPQPVCLTGASIDANSATEWLTGKIELHVLSEDRVGIGGGSTEKRTLKTGVPPLGSRAG